MLCCMARSKSHWSSIPQSHEVRNSTEKWLLSPRSSIHDHLQTWPGFFLFWRTYWSDSMERQASESPTIFPWLLGLWEAQRRNSFLGSLSSIRHPLCPPLARPICVTLSLVFSNSSKTECVWRFCWLEDSM